MKKILIGAFVLFLLGAIMLVIITKSERQRMKELMLKLDSVEIGDTSCEIIEKMKDYPDMIYFEDSISCYQKYYYNFNTYMYVTPIGSSSNIYFYISEEKDTLFHVFYDI